MRMKEKLNGLEDSVKQEKREVFTQLRRLESFTLILMIIITL